MTTTPPRITPRLGAATTRVPAASREDSRPQAILKLHRPSSLDYRARHGLPVLLEFFGLCKFAIIAIFQVFDFVNFFIFDP